MSVNKLGFAAKWVICAAIGCFSLTSQAAGLRFLNNTVLADLTSEEVTSFKTTIRKALDKAPDAKVIKWQSPTAKKAGKILPKFSYQTNGVQCRRTLFQLSEEVEGRKENYRFDICQNATGWEVVAAPSKLSKDNLRLAVAFLNKALDHQEVGQPASWVAADAENSAVVVPLSETENNCRSAAISLGDKAGRRSDGQYRFCKNAQGDWDYKP